MKFNEAIVHYRLTLIFVVISESLLWFVSSKRGVIYSTVYRTIKTFEIPLGYDKWVTVWICPGMKHY